MEQNQIQPTARELARLTLDQVVVRSNQVAALNWYESEIDRLEAVVAELEAAMPVMEAAPEDEDSESVRVKHAYAGSKIRNSIGKVGRVISTSPTGVTIDWGEDGGGIGSYELAIIDRMFGDGHWQFVTEPQEVAETPQEDEPELREKGVEPEPLKVGDAVKTKDSYKGLRPGLKGIVKEVHGDLVMVLWPYNFEFWMTLPELERIK